MSRLGSRSRDLRERNRRQSGPHRSRGCAPGSAQRQEEREPDYKPQLFRQSHLIVNAIRATTYPPSEGGSLMRPGHRPVIEHLVEDGLLDAMLTSDVAQRPARSGGLFDDL